MSLDWIKCLASPLGLLFILSACQPTAYQRGHAQPASNGYFDVNGGYCKTECFRGNVDIDDGRTRGYQANNRSCPPGYRLVRLSYLRHGDSARDCVPETPRRSHRYAAGPDCRPADNVYARSYDRSYRPTRYRQDRYRPLRQRTRDTSCCY